jgi:hypothetical protein
MRVLNHFETLVYYDGPQLFVAHDQLSVAYVCLLAERGANADRYLCTPVSQARLNDFLNSQIDLLSIFDNPESDEIFTCDITDDRYSKIEIVPISRKEIPPEWLPDPGFLMEREAVLHIKVIEESQQRQRAIIHCSLNPPESRSESKITAEHLGQAVRLMQRVIKHAFRKALRGLDDRLKREIDTPENYELEVFAFSGGSFTIHMQTAMSADIVGYSQVAKALNVLDSVNQVIDNPKDAVDVVAAYGGHFATAYKDLIQFIVESETPLSYEWSMPELKQSIVRRITVNQAQPLYEALVKQLKSQKCSEKT